jgi:hypothetical protein
VVSIAVKPGDEVKAGGRLAVLEAMKMEMPVVAPFSGTVRKILTIANVQVDTGAPLVQIERAATDVTTSVSERVCFGASMSAYSKQMAPAPCQDKLEEARRFMLGFDVEPTRTARLLSDWRNACPFPVDDHEVKRSEDDILNIFVDICSLFHRYPRLDRSAGGERPSNEAQLFSYLRTLDIKGEGLPPTFLEAVRRALAHYGVKSLDRTPELQESLLWIYKSHQRVEHQMPLIQSLLERRLERIDPTPEESFRILLDRMIEISNGVFPSVSDIAREVRYRCFDQPLFERARREVHDEAERHLAYLLNNPDGTDRGERWWSVHSLCLGFSRDILRMLGPIYCVSCWRYSLLDTTECRH